MKVYVCADGQVFDNAEAAQKYADEKGISSVCCTDLHGGVIEGALEAVLLFQRGGAWGAPERMIWERITGERDATTRVLCDHVRKVLGARPASVRATFDEWCNDFVRALEQAGLHPNQARRYLAGAIYSKTSLSYFTAGVSLDDAVKRELLGDGV